MSARTVWEAAAKSASATRTATVQASELTRQESVNSVGVNAGSNPQLGASSSQIATIASANAAKLAAVYSAEIARQAAWDAAREVLRATGDVGPL